MSFYCSWTTRRRACAGWHVTTQDSVEWHSRVPAALRSRSCPHVERAQDTARSVASSRKSRRIASLLTRLCHKTWTGSRWMYEKTGTAWVRRLKGLRSGPRRFPSGTDMADHMAPLKDTAQNQTQTAPQDTDSRLSYPRWALPILRSARGPNWAPLAHFEVPQVVEHMRYKMIGPSLKKRSMFAM